MAVVFWVAGALCLLAPCWCCGASDLADRSGGGSQGGLELPGCVAFGPNTVLGHCFSATRPTDQLDYWFIDYSSHVTLNRISILLSEDPSERQRFLQPTPIPTEDNLTHPWQQHMSVG